MRYIELLTEKTGKCVPGSEQFISADSCLWRSSGSGNISLMNYFINKGADIVSGLEGAAAAGNIELFNKFVEQYRIPDYTTALNYSLENAAIYGQLEMVKYLIDQGATDLNKQLILATRYGHLEIVQYLIDHGANDLNRGLSEAASHGYFDIVQYLISRGANDFCFFWRKFKYYPIFK